MKFLEVNGIGKQIGLERVLDSISFELLQGVRLGIAGETGSGKSTLLKIIAGLVQADEGQVRFEGEKVTGPWEKLVPGHPSIAYLSQHFELRNNYRVEEILEYNTKISEADAALMFQICRIDHLLKRRTDELSGGEKQRIALARLLVGSPKLLILDEPFSNLDISHRSVILSVLEKIGTQFGTSMIMVSHDPADLLSWAEQILILKNGRLLESGSPQSIYRQPQHLYTAGLFGRYNLLTGQMAQRLNMPVRDAVDNLLIRPEDILIVPKENAATIGRVVKISFFGAFYEVYLAVDETELVVRCRKEEIPEEPTTGLQFDPSTICHIR